MGNKIKQSDFEVKTLGPCKITSPSLRSTSQSIPQFHFVKDTERVLFETIYDTRKNGLGDHPLNMEIADPGKKSISILPRLRLPSLPVEGCVLESTLLSEV